MTVQANWQDPANPLLKLATVLKVAPKLLEASEDADKLHLRDEHFPTEIARQLSFEVLWPLVEAYGTAITFELYLGKLLVLKVDDQLSEAKLEEFRQKTERTPTLVLDLKLDKTALLELWEAGHLQNAVGKLFLFSGALTRALGASLEQLERDLLRDANGEHKIVILVPEHDILLDGDYLAVVGRPEITQWRNYLPSAAPNQERVRHVHAQAEPLKWTFFNLDFLTPLQLVVSEPRDKRRIRQDDALALALYERLVELSLIYTADQTKAPRSDSKSLPSSSEVPASDSNALKSDPKTVAPSTWRATYTAESYVAEVAFGHEDALKQALADLNAPSYPWDLPLTLATMALWAYTGEQDRVLGRSDRIHVLQGVIAHTLQGNDSLLNYREIVRQAGHLKQEVEWGWAAFVEGKLNVYFSRVRDVEQMVDSLVKSFSEQVQALTKALTDNMLAAVGVVVGSFIAAVFKDKFNSAIFQLGLVVYAIYLVFFPGLIGLISTWQRYRDSLDAFNQRRVEFSKRLFPDEVNKIVGTTVQERQDRFKKWLVIAAIAYVAVAIALVIAAMLVPGIVGTSAQVNTTPTSPIATPTP